MKRRDLLKALADIAKAQNLETTITEGAKHTKVQVGDKVTVVPRHNEINEITAKAIIKQMTSTEGSN